MEDRPARLGWEADDGENMDLREKGNLLWFASTDRNPTGLNLIEAIARSRFAGGEFLIAPDDGFWIKDLEPETFTHPLLILFYSDEGNPTALLEYDPEQMSERWRALRTGDAEAYRIAEEKEKNS